MGNDETNSKIGWQFDNSYVRLSEFFYTKQQPDPVDSPSFIKLNETLATSLGLNVQALHKEGVAMFAGNKMPDKAEPIAQAYAGHQFGNFTMLGDGRAVLIGEHLTPDNRRVDIQLKGSGRTVYSRGGDGRAALGPMLREYIISEAMYALGIPTTRSLAVVTTGEEVIRETDLPGAILTRVAASHIRVGTFEYVAQWGTEEELMELVEYTIERHYPQLQENEHKAKAFLQEVIHRQAKLIAKWQLIGFIHGVMNTDNMTISGETIDYGPCAFMDTYNPATVFSSIDRQGRYQYQNQPGIGGWNLARFAETLIPVLHENEEKAIEIAQASLNDYGKLFQYYWLTGMRAKLGISNEEADDVVLIDTLLQLMEKYKADYTNTFLSLTFQQFEDEAIFQSDEFIEWQEKWLARLERQPLSKSTREKWMSENNPAVIPRNHRVEEALEAAVEREDYSVMERLLTILATPYAHTKEQEQYASPPPDDDEPYQTFCGT